VSTPVVSAAVVSAPVAPLLQPEAENEQLHRSERARRLPAGRGDLVWRIHEVRTQGSSLESAANRPPPTREGRDYHLCARMPRETMFHVQDGRLSIPLEQGSPFMQDRSTRWWLRIDYQEDVSMDPPPL